VLTWKKSVLCILIGVALAVPGRAQMWGIGASYGSVNNVNDSFTLDGFKPSEVTGWLDYRMESATLLRLTYGSMWTNQALAGQTVTTSTSTVTVPGAKERVNSMTVDVSYQVFEGFFTSGLFAGIGGYHFRPETMPPEYAAYQDENETVFGWNAGADGEFRVMNHLWIVLRLTYHNVAAHPHRQFFNAAAGLVGRF